MNTKLCWMLGIVAGGAVGLLVGLLHGTVCCGGGSPPIGQLMLNGLFVALIAVFLGAAFACLVNHLPVKPVFTLSLLIGIVVGVLLGPLAYYSPNPGLALFVCTVLGALLGWLICRILCESICRILCGARGTKLEVSR
jgi:hypothetical protein